MRNIVLLGGSGFIGRKLARSLCDKNHVTIVDLQPPEELNEYENVGYVKYNFTSETGPMTFLDGTDVVVHLISTIFPADGTDQVLEDVEKNVIPTIRLLNEMKTRCPNAQIVFVSSGGTVYGEGNGTPNREDTAQEAYCSYALTKIMIEQTIKLYSHQNNLRYKVLRLGNPYGYSSNSKRMQGAIPIFVQKIIHNEKITIWGDGKNTRDYIFLDDVIEAIVRVIDSTETNLVLNVGSGVSYSTLQVLDRIERLIGSELSTTVEFSKARKCDLQHSALDISNIQSTVNWTPKHTLDEGIMLVIDEYKRRMKDIDQ